MCADTGRANTVLIGHIIRNSRGSRKNSKNRRKRYTCRCATLSDAVIPLDSRIRADLNRQRPL